MNYILVKKYLGAEVGTVVSESDNYNLETEHGTINLKTDFLNNSEFFEEFNKKEVNVSEYNEDDTRKKFKFELVIECNISERNNIREFLEKNIEKIKKGIW